MTNKWIGCVVFSIWAVNAFALTGGMAQQTISGKAKQDLLILLKPGKHVADVMDSVVQTPQQRELAERFKASIQKNYQWFVDYMAKVPAGEPLPYHENMGLTEAEYKAYLTAAENPVITSSEKDTLTIFKNDSIISFRGSGKLYVFDSVKIYLSNNTATVLDFQLGYADTVRETSSKNAVGSKWFGHAYFLEFPRDLKPEDYKVPEKLYYTRFKLVIAQLQKTGKTFFEFTALKISKGEKLFDFKIPIVFR
jgi:hypothetical protein